MSEDTPNLTERGAFRFWITERLRFADTDMLGHVNNAVFATFCESGRVAFLYDPRSPLTEPGTDFVIARLVLDFRAEMYYPGEVEIGTRVLSIGRSSMVLGQGLFKDGQCVATSEAVIVLIDHATRRSRPLSDAMRARLEAL